MRQGKARLVQEFKRDPPGSELLLGAEILGRRLCGAVGDLVGGPRVTKIEQFACDQSPLDPPLVGIDERIRVARGRQHPLRGILDLVRVAQVQNQAEYVSGIVLRLLRYGGQQILGVARLAVHGGARPRNRDIRGIEVLRCPHRRFIVPDIKPRIHARLVVGRRDQSREFCPR